jgi:hypothetical protein
MSVDLEQLLQLEPLTHLRHLRARLHLPLKYALGPLLVVVPVQLRWEKQGCEHGSGKEVGVSREAAKGRG